MQYDDSHATGTVQVQVAEDGQPRFEITKWVAWDYLQWTPEFKELASRADAVCFGSLAQREAESRSTIQHFLHATRKDALRVFDVNLRQSFYSRDVLAASAKAADIVKLNHEELPKVLYLLGGPQLEQLSAVRWLRQKFGIKLICVTRGDAGSLLLTEKEYHEHFGHHIQVADTVGAGDAFTATLVHHYLRGSDLATMNDAANRMGSWVASKPGATPTLDQEIIQKARAGAV